MIQVVTVNEENSARYAAYVAGHPAARFEHDLEWGRVLRETYGAHPEYLLALDGEQAVGACPLFLCKPLTGGAHYQTSLFPTYAGPLYDSPAALDGLLTEIQRRTSALDYSEILVPEALPADERLPFVEQLDFTYKLPLDKGAEAIFGGFRRNYKRILRDPKFHEDVELIVDSDGKLVRDFHQLYARLYARKHGFIPHVEKLFRRTFAHYPNGAARIYMARHRGKFIGGIFTFWKYGEVYCGWSAQDTNTGYLPMHFLIWQIIQDGVAQGFRWFNHGEAEKENESLRLFKQGWGMQEGVPLRYFLPGKQARPVPRLYDQFAWTRKVIALLPSGVTTTFVSPLIRYML